MLIGFVKALHNAWSPIIAAIFAGNGIVVKCSEHVVWSTSWFIGTIRECLTVCGFDPDLVQVWAQACRYVMVLTRDSWFVAGQKMRKH